jgi:hypothetical protein
MLEMTGGTLPSKCPLDASTCSSSSLIATSRTPIRQDTFTVVCYREWVLNNLG